MELSQHRPQHAPDCETWPTTVSGGRTGEGQGDMADSDVRWCERVRGAGRREISSTTSGSVSVDVR